MENTDYLIILLSIGMGFVLLLTIIALFYIVKILKSIKMVTEKAEHIADNVDAASMFFKKSAGPAAIAKIVANMIDAVRTRK